MNVREDGEFGDGVTVRATSDRLSNERLDTIASSDLARNGEAQKMARELQHLRSPVTVSDEMVEVAIRAFVLASMPQTSSADYDKSVATMSASDIETAHSIMRAVLTAALVPAEQEGESKGHWPDDKTFEETTTPSGDSRAVAWRWRSKGVVNFTTEAPPARMPVVACEALVTLSTLEAVERERDTWKNTADAVGRYSADERTRAENAEASLAAARDALTPSGDTKAAYSGEFAERIEIANPMFEGNEDDEPETIMQSVPVSWTTIKEIMAAISARAALAGSNGE